MLGVTGDQDALVQAGAALYQRGQFEAAASCGRKALKSRPAHLGALNLLGVSLNALGKHSKASETFAELTRRDPGNADHWMNLGTALKACQQHDRALAAYAHAGRLGERSADFYYNVGLVHLAMGNFEAARTVLKDAARLAPHDAEICFQYAVCCDETMRLDEALAALDGWQGKHGLTTDLLARLALLFMKLGDLRDADQAVALASRDSAPEAEALLGIVQVQERTNRLQEARAGLARLKADPRSGTLVTDLEVVEARLAERDGRMQAALDLYAAQLARIGNMHERHRLLFPLASTLDALGRHDEAMAALEEAHRSQLAFLELAIPGAAARKGPSFRIADHGCDAADVAEWDAAGAPAAEESPVFIVGFPRSGTTLLEQTLDAHASLVSMDETRFVHDVIDRMVGDGIAYPESLASLTRAKLDGLRECYWSLVLRRVRLKPGQRLLDKNPLNLLALPAIRRLFPHSRILFAVRHPCDVILSCYFQHFRAPEFIRLCRDLASLGAGYRRALDFWYRETAILKSGIREVRYETLAAEFEPQVRAIAGFLGLDWSDAMLSPGEHARARGFISTPSYTQVVQPVHTRSVGRWKSYERHLGETIASVQPYLDRWGYRA
jgi:tetratricopeptide (TPR) repeat protein